MAGRGFRLFREHEFAGLVDALARAAGVRVGDAVYALRRSVAMAALPNSSPFRAADLAPKPHSREL